MKSARYASLATLVLAGCSHLQNFFAHENFPQLSKEVCTAVAQRQGSYGMMQGTYGINVELKQEQTGVLAIYSFGDSKSQEIITLVDKDCNGGLNTAQICDFDTGECKVYSDLESLLPLYTSLTQQIHAGLYTGTAELTDIKILYEKALDMPTSVSFEGPIITTYGPFELARHTNVTGDGTIIDRTYIIKKNDAAILFYDGGVLGDLDKIRACNQEKETKCTEPSVDDAMPLFMHVKAAIEDKIPYDNEFLMLFEEFFKSD